MITTFDVTQTIAVELDESKFTPEFLAEFSKHMFDLETVDDHAAHLAELFATGHIDGYPAEFVEGYGGLDEMGIKLKKVEIWTEKES